MLKKILIILLALFILFNCVSASDNWSKATVGYEEFEIPPQYENPYKSDFNMYEADKNIDVFTIRYVNPNIMNLYGYYLEKYQSKKVNVSGHDAVHFTYYDRHDESNNSILWFSSGEEFYYINWIGHNITKDIKKIVNSSSPSAYTHDEFYQVLNEEYQNYKIVNSIESQRFDYPRESRYQTFYSYGTNGFSFGTVHNHY